MEMNGENLGNSSKVTSFYDQSQTASIWTEPEMDAIITTLHCRKNITSVVKKVKIYVFFVKCLKFFMSRFRSTGFLSKFPNFL